VISPGLQIRMAHAGATFTLSLYSLSYSRGWLDRVLNSRLRCMSSVGRKSDVLPPFPCRRTFSADTRGEAVALRFWDSPASKDDLLLPCGLPGASSEARSLVWWSPAPTDSRVAAARSLVLRLLRRKRMPPPSKWVGTRCMSPGAAAGGGELSSGSYFVSPLDQSEAGASTQDSLTHSRADLLFLRASLRLKFHWEVSDALRLPTGIAARNVSDSEGPAPSMAAWGTTAAVPCRPLLPAKLKLLGTTAGLGSDCTSSSSKSCSLDGNAFPKPSPPCLLAGDPSRPLLPIPDMAGPPLEPFLEGRPSFDKMKLRAPELC